MAPVFQGANRKGAGTEDHLSSSLREGGDSGGVMREQRVEGGGAG